MLQFCFSLSVQEKPSRYQESSHCQYQLRDVNIFIYICRRLSHTRHLGICVILRKNSLSERSELWGFRRMLLADFRMPSMTGSEAVDKYIYIPERPPDSIFLQTISVFLSPYNQITKIPLFQCAPFHILQENTTFPWFLWWTQPLCKLRYIQIWLFQQLLMRLPLANDPLIIQTIRCLR